MPRCWHPAVWLSLIWLQPTLQQTQCSCVSTTIGCYQSGQQCFKCPPGSWSAALSSACTLCVPGKYNALVGQVNVYACDVSPKGSYTSTAGASAYVPCPNGFYQPSTGTTACLQCPLNRGNQGEGNVMCTECGKAELSELPVYDTNVKQCVALEAGYYVDNFQARPCTVCANGKYVSSACNATTNTVCSACRQCSVGTYQAVPCTDNANAKCETCTVCRPAPLDYQTQVCLTSANQNAQCSPCVASQTSPGGVCNPCPRGSVASASHCVLCEPNTYFDVQSYECVACPVGEVSGGGSERCVGAGGTAQPGAVLVASEVLLGPSFSAGAFFTPSEVLVARMQDVYVLGPTMQLLTAEDIITEMVVVADGLMVASGATQLQWFSVYDTAQGLQALAPQTLYNQSAVFVGMCLLGNGTVLMVTATHTVRASRNVQGVWSSTFAPRQQPVLALYGVQPWIQPNSFLTWDHNSVYLHASSLTAYTVLMPSTRVFALLTVPEAAMLYWVRPADEMVQAYNVQTSTSVALPAVTAQRLCLDAQKVYVMQGSTVKRLLLPNDCACGPGTYCHEGACVDAPIGHYAPGYEFEAWLCPAGYSGTLPGQRSMELGCKPCPPSFTSTNTRVVCVPPALVAAESCPQRFLQGVCGNCPPGTGIPAGGGDCVRCGHAADVSFLFASNSFYNVSSKVCMPCPSGEKAFPGAFRCSSGPRADAWLMLSGEYVSMSISYDSTAALVLADEGGQVRVCPRESSSCSTLVGGIPVHMVLQSRGVLYAAPMQEQGCVLSAQGTPQWTTLAGTCGAMGDSDALYVTEALLGTVEGLAVALGGTQLVVSSLQPCAVLRIVDLTGAHHAVHTLLHWDVGRMPMYLQDTCTLTPLQIGTYSKWLFAADGAVVYRVDLLTTTSGITSSLASSFALVFAL